MAHQYPLFTSQYIVYTLKSAQHYNTKVTGIFNALFPPTACDDFITCNEIFSRELVIFLVHHNKEFLSLWEKNVSLVQSGLACVTLLANRAVGLALHLLIFNLTSFQTYP